MRDGSSRRRWVTRLIRRSLGGARWSWCGLAGRGRRSHGSLSHRRRRSGTGYERHLDEGTSLRWSDSKKREGVAARECAAEAEEGDSGWVRSGGRLSFREFFELAEGKQTAFPVFTMRHVLEVSVRKVLRAAGPWNPRIAAQRISTSSKLPRHRHSSPGYLLPVIPKRNDKHPSQPMLRQGEALPAPRRDTRPLHPGHVLCPWTQNPHQSSTHIGLAFPSPA